MSSANSLGSWPDSGQGAARVRILAVSGSLRAASINSTLLRAAGRVAPPGFEVELFTGLAYLPLFNPDLEGDPPTAVEIMREMVRDADALLIASPEYAHGVAAPMKNALDWLVSYEPFVGKPVALINTSPRASHADAALRETLRTMSALLVESASITIPLLGRNLSALDIAADSHMATALVRALQALGNAHRAVLGLQTSPSHGNAE